MITKGLSKSHRSVLNALGDKHLTSFELFKRVESISEEVKIKDSAKESS